MQSMFLLMSDCFFPEFSFWKISFHHFFFFFFKEPCLHIPQGFRKIFWKYVG